MRLQDRLYWQGMELLTNIVLPISSSGRGQQQIHQQKMLYLLVPLLVLFWMLTCELLELLQTIGLSLMPF